MVCLLLSEGFLGVGCGVGRVLLQKWLRDDSVKSEGVVVFCGVCRGGLRCVGCVAFGSVACMAGEWRWLARRKEQL